MSKKVLVAALFTILALCTVPILAQAKLPSFQGAIGGGQVAASTSGNPIAYQVSWQTNVTAEFRYFPTEKFAISAQYTHDNVRIGYWLVRHNFFQTKPTEGIQYQAFNVCAEYWPVRSASGGVYVFAGPQEFWPTGGQKSALGLTAGVGAQYTLLGNFFVESRASFWHVQDIAQFKVVNTYDLALLFGYRF